MNAWFHRQQTQPIQEIVLALTSYITIWNKVKIVSKTAWAEKATSFAATGIICNQNQHHHKRQNIKKITKSNKKHNQSTTKSANQSKNSNLIKPEFLTVLPLHGGAKEEGSIVDEVGRVLRQIQQRKIKIQPHHTERTSSSSSTTTTKTQEIKGRISTEWMRKIAPFAAEI